MKIKFEIERKIEDDNGKKSEKETTISFDDIPDVKKAAKKVGTFFAKKAKETAEKVTGVAAGITYNVAATTANALESVVDTAEMAVNSIDRFIDEKFEVVEEIDEEFCDGQCCGECCCGETCEDDLADIIDEIIEELEEEDDEADEDSVEDDAECGSDEETAEDDSSDESEEDPVEAFLKGVIGDVEKISTDVIAFIKADDAEKAEVIKKVEEYIGNLGEKFANHLGIIIKKTEKTSEDEEDAYEDEIEKVSVDSAYADESAEDVVPEKSIEEKLAEIPEDAKVTLAEYLDYLGMYKCEDKIVDMKKEACIFFAAIGYPASFISRLAFETSATLGHINYNSVSDKIIEYIPDMTKDQIVEALKSDFDKWLETREDVCKYCPKPQFRFLLKYFVKKVRGC